MSGDLRFKALLDEMWELHQEKSEGYGTDEDSLANLRESVEWGMPLSMGAFLRAGDKFRRLKNWFRKGNLPGDSLHNDARDGAAYLLLGLILHEEEHGDGTRLPLKVEFREVGDPAVDNMIQDVREANAGAAAKRPRL